MMILRGLNMRPAYRKVAGLQSVINACILVLASTATRKIQEDIYMTHGIKTDTTKIVVILPDRFAGLLPNSFLLFNWTTIKCYDNSKLKISLPLQAIIFLNMKNSTGKIERLDWMVEHIKGNQSQRKMLIYV